MNNSDQLGKDWTRLLTALQILKSDLELDDLRRRHQWDEAKLRYDKLELEIKDLQKKARWDEYDLRVDQQVEKFLDMKHKLVFFLITASVGSLAYTLNFSANRLSQFFDHPWRASILVAGCIVGLLASGAALYSLNQEVRSYQFHLGARYNRKSYDELTPAEQKNWDRVNNRGKRFQALALTLLFVSVCLQAVLFMMFIF